MALYSIPRTVQPRTRRSLFDNVLADFSPVVQAVPPTVALVEPKGALRRHGTGTRRLGRSCGSGPCLALASTSASAPAPRCLLATPSLVRGPSVELRMALWCGRVSLMMGSGQGIGATR